MTWLAPVEFSCSGGFVSVVPVVPVVPVVSFRRFRFGVSGFSTCRDLHVS